MVMTDGFVVRAPAKINLDLRIVGRRPDGYHELQTIFQSLELHDTLAITSRDGPFVLRCATAGVPTDEQNLVCRAAATLWTASGRAGAPAGAVVVLTKRIPPASGLGGGSSDAAAALIGLSRLWRMNRAREELREIAAGIGADVPYFLEGGSALGLGRGDQIFSLRDLPRRWVVLALPEPGVSTAEAYGWYDADRRPVNGLRPGVLRWPAVDRLVNDLEEPVVRRRPAVGRARDLLADAGAARAGMTGSGSAVFGLFASPARASSAARALRRQRFRVVLTRTLRRAAFARWTTPVGRLARLGAHELK